MKLNHKEANIQPVDDIHKCRQFTNDGDHRCSKIIYNRVPKCASRTLNRVISVLSKERNFTFLSTDPPPSRANFFHEVELKVLNSFIIYVILLSL